jgi:hypothetical protein
LVEAHILCASYTQSDETITGANKQLLEGLTFNMDRTQESLLELRRLRGKYGPLRTHSERIIDEISIRGLSGLFESSKLCADYHARGKKINEMGLQPGS